MIVTPLTGQDWGGSVQLAITLFLSFRKDNEQAADDRRRRRETRQLKLPCTMHGSSTSMLSWDDWDLERETARRARKINDDGAVSRPRHWPRQNSSSPPSRHNARRWPTMTSRHWVQPRLMNELLFLRLALGTCLSVVLYTTIFPFVEYRTAYLCCFALFNFTIIMFAVQPVLGNSALFLSLTSLPRKWTGARPYSFLLFLFSNNQTGKIIHTASVGHHITIQSILWNDINKDKYPATCVG